MEDFAGATNRREQRAHSASQSSDSRPQPLAMPTLKLFEAVERDWQEFALCAQTDPDAFFPDKGGSAQEAKRICKACSVRDECLEFALINDERFGIWGGRSQREREEDRARLFG